MSADGSRARLPEDLDEMPVDAELFALLASVNRGQLCGADQVRLARARNRVAAHVQGELLVDLYAVTRDEAADEEAMVRNDASRWPWAEYEVAYALTWTHMAAGARLEQARQLVEELPDVLTWLRSGRLDVPKVLVFCDLLAGVEPEVVGRVVDQVLPAAAGLTTGQLRAKLRRLVLAADPAAAARRFRDGVTGRQVRLLDNPDGTADLSGRGLAPQGAAAAFERVNAVARAAKAAGDGRSLEQLRADAYLDLLAGTGVAAGGQVTVRGGPPAETPAAAPVDTSVSSEAAAGVMPGPRRGVVELQVPLTTLMSLTHLPGELAGFGPVVADIARQTAEAYRDGRWLFSVYNEVGALVHHGTTKARPRRGRRGRRRRPDAPTAASVRARHRTCTAPGCRAPNRDADLDHITDWAAGGDSTVDNLDPKCRLHHVYKHQSGARVIPLGDGITAWTTPRGLQYVTAPDAPLLDDALFRLLPAAG